MPVLADQQELTNYSSVWTQYVVWKICWKQWMIGMDSERELEKSMLAMWLDDDDDDEISLVLSTLYYDDIYCKSKERIGIQ